MPEMLVVICYITLHRKYSTSVSFCGEKFLTNEISK